MSKNKGKKIKLVSSKMALQMLGYKSLTSLNQFHEDEGFTCYEIAGSSRTHDTGRAGILRAWSKKEINKWLQTDGRDTEEWLID